MPPFKLDLWLAAHEFATPPIRYNLASSTGPLWTLGELMALGQGRMGGGSLRQLEDVKLSYAPPEGSKLLRQRIAALHDVDPDHVLLMRTASSSGVGSRPISCSICREMRFSLLMVSIMCTGMRMVRAWSAIERVMAWRIHHVA